MKSPREAIKQAMQKLPKDDPRVEYGHGKPQHHCGPVAAWDYHPHYCRFFQSPDACEKVSGKISHTGGCLLYQKAADA